MSLDFWGQAVIIIKNRLQAVISKGRAIDPLSPPTYTAGEPVPFSIDKDTGAIMTKSVSGSGTSITEYSDGATVATPQGNVILGKTAANLLHSFLIASDGTLHVTIDALSSALDSITAVSNVVSSISSPTDLKCSTAGTPVQGATITVTKEVIITAYQSNAGTIYIGDSAVSNASGTKLGVVLTPGGQIRLAISNLNLIYINADNNNDRAGVLVT